MSLVRSTALFGNHELYSLNDGNCCESCSVDSYDPKYSLDSPSEYLISQSPGNIDYDEDKMRLKFLELENALLDDNNNNNNIMEIDGEWSDDTIHSPKESSVSDSNLKEISFATPKSLLFECATAIYNGNIKEAMEMINVLRQRVAIQGEPSERIAAYMVEVYVNSPVMYGLFCSIY